MAEPDHGERISSVSDRIAIVTGTGGLGFELALALSGMGVKVILAGRNAEKGEEALQEIRRRLPTADVEFASLDLADLSSVARFADGVLKRGIPLHILVNNAGIMSPPMRQVTRDGFELQFGVNYLGHFALTLRLLPLLAGAGAARVVNVTSLAQHQGRMDFGNLQSEKKYKPGVAYCQSKLAQAIFTRELQRRCDAHGLDIVSLAAHPGFARTQLFANGAGAGSLADRISTYVAGPLLGHSAAAGALPLLHAAVDASVERGALYGPTGWFGMKGPPGLAAYARRALDEDVAASLWVESEKLTHLTWGEMVVSAHWQDVASGQKLS